MPPEELLELSHHLTARSDSFISGIIAAGLEYGTRAAISAGKPKDIDLETCRQVLERFSDDIKEKKSTGGSRLNPVLFITPTRAPPREVQRTSQESGDRNQGRPQTQQQSRVYFQGNSPQGQRK